MPCLINISRVAIASSISIESIAISPILKSTFGAGLLRSFRPSSEYPIVRRVSTPACYNMFAICLPSMAAIFYEKILFLKLKLSHLKRVSRPLFYFLLYFRLHFRLHFSLSTNQENPNPYSPDQHAEWKEVLFNIHCHWGSRRWLLRGLFCYSDWLVFGLSLLSLGLFSFTPPGFRTFLTSRDTHRVLHFLWPFSLGPFSGFPGSPFLSMAFLFLLKLICFAVTVVNIAVNGARYIPYL